MHRESTLEPRDVLHSFNADDGANPYAGLIKDAAANLYGTTPRAA
jgi:hypothetical protein